MLMINTNILQGLKPHCKEGETDTSPTFFTIIRDVEPKTECNQDDIEFTLYRVNKDIREVLDGSTFYKKKFTVTSRMEITDEDLYTTKLFGYESDMKILSRCKNCKNCLSDSSNILYCSENYEKFDKDKTIWCPHFSYKYEEIPKNHIEIIETTLQKTIDIDFNNVYEGVDRNNALKYVSVIVNMEEEYESLYRSYSTEYKRNEDNNITGVKISFKNLKTKQSYPHIRVTIIGVPVETIKDELFSFEMIIENITEENTGD